MLELIKCVCVCMNIWLKCLHEMNDKYVYNKIFPMPPRYFYLFYFIFHFFHVVTAEWHNKKSHNMQENSVVARIQQTHQNIILYVYDRSLKCVNFMTENIRRKKNLHCKHMHITTQQHHASCYHYIFVFKNFLCHTTR